MSATPTVVISPEASVRHHQALSLSQSAVSPLTVVTKPAAASSALMMPASVPYYVVVVAVLAGDLLGKEVFGGVGCYPFHPVAVGYAIACAN